MAVRYSGDAEVKLQYDASRKAYYGEVRDPYHVWRGRVPPRLSFRRSPESHEAYDDAAASLLLLADKASGNRLLLAKSGRRIKVSRLFQAPCPIGPSPQPYVRRMNRRGV